MSANIVGLSEFREWIQGKSSQYSIFAIQAPVEDVAGALTKLVKVEAWQKNIDREGTLAELRGVPIVRLKGSSWAIAFWSIGRYLSLQRECQQLSQKIETRVIQIWETDASGWIEWLVWERGEEREGCERMVDDDAYFRSSLRRKPNLENLKGETLRKRLESFVNDLLVEQGVGIPSFDIGLSEASIDRIDLLILPPRPLGILEFQSWIYQGQPEYSIFAVKADIDRVSQAIAQYCQAEDWKKEIKSTTTIWKVVEEQGWTWMPLVQPKDNDWTVVYWLLGDWTDVFGVCRKISASLDAKVIELGEEDTSGGISYSLFEGGEQIERASWAPGFEFYFESQLRDEPEFEDFEKSENDTICDYINERFIEEGIYIPPWTLSVSDEWLTRIDLVPRS